MRNTTTSITKKLLLTTDNMMIRPYMSIRLLEPGGRAPVTRNVQDRLFFEYRNKGFGVVLDAHLAAPDVVHVPQHLSRSSSSSTSPIVLSQNVASCSSVSVVPSTHPIIVETISQLRALHHPAFVYKVCLRRSYNIATFQTFLGVVADPNEPFNSADSDLQDLREFAYSFSPSEKSFVEEWLDVHHPKSRTGRRPAVPRDKVRVDCVAVNEHCSALVTSCAELTEDFLVDFSALGHMLFCFLKDPRCENERFRARWGNFFAPRLHKPRLYVGVGAPEFGDGSSVVSSPELLAMAHRVASSPAPLVSTKDAVLGTMRDSHLLGKARQLGVTVLHRRDMRYTVCR